MLILGLILKFILLALAAITPGMLVAVSFLLSLDRGLFRSGIFMIGRIVTYIAWCVLLFIFTDRVFDLGFGTPLVFKLVVEATIGLFLIGMALKIVLGGNDFDALPTKVVDLFTRMSSIQLFGLGILVSLFQVRHILLVFVGITEIIITGLSISQTIFATLILILMINASPIMLMGVYFVLADRADTFLQSTEAWLTKNNRRVAIIISLIGIYLLWDSINGLGIFW